MKTVKSTTAKKSDLAQAQQAFADFGVKYITEWTQQELKRYRTQPVVIPNGSHGFFVGPYVIDGVHSECWLVKSTTNDTSMFAFISKPAAIFYCLYNIKQKYNQATELLQLDTKLGRLDSDLRNYEYAIHAAQKKGDRVKSAIMLNRYIDAKMQRQAFQKIMKKTLNAAKYLNFGNKPL
jgi:hypothetical protein